MKSIGVEAFQLILQLVNCGRASFVGDLNALTQPESHISTKGPIEIV